MSHILLRLPPSLLIVLMIGALNANAQALQNQKVNNKEIAAFAMYIDQNGGARVTLSVPRKGEEVDALRDTLSRSFSFPLTVDRPRQEDFDDEDDEDNSTGQREWTYFEAYCAQPFAVQGMLSSANVKLAELAHSLKPLGITSLWITVGFIKPVTNPRVNITGGEAVRMRMPIFYQAKISTDNPAGANINISMGYAPSDILFRSLPLVAFITVPLILVLWKGRLVLKLKAQPAEMWGRYFQFLAHIFNSLWLIWIPLCAWSNLYEILRVALGSQARVAAEVVQQLLWVGPPILVMWLCHLSSRQVYRNVRGAEWSATDVVRRFVVASTIGFLPLVVIIVVITSARGRSQLAGILSVFAVVGAVSVVNLVTRSVRLSIYAVTTGELRDRVFQLAQRAGINLKQIYVLPEGKAQLSNAFARSDNAVMLTASLLRHLSKREVDVIMSHELGHLKEKHPQRKATTTIVTLLAINFVVLSFASTIDIQRWAPAILSLGLAGATFVLHFLSRSNERHADAIAISLTGDPESFISGLAKMSRLNLMPMHAGRIEFGTHPKTLGRLQDVARLHGISPERFQVLIAGDAADEEHYTVDQVNESKAKIFSTTFKQKYFHRISLAILAIVVLTPILIATLVPQLHLDGRLTIIAYLSGPVVTWLLYLVVRNFLIGAGFRKLESQMRAKINAKGLPQAAHEAFFVGLAPADHPRRYERIAFWDIGLLWLNGDRMYYLGEETSFALSRAEIGGTRPGIIEPTLMPRKCLYVDWTDELSGNEQTFYLVTAAASGLENKGQTLVLGERIKNWLSDTEPAPPAAEASLNLTPPAFASITSDAPKTKFEPTLVLRSAVTLSVLGFPFCFLLRVPFGNTCYAIAMVAMMALVDELPKLFYGGLMLSPQPTATAPTRPSYQPGSWLESDAAKVQD